MINKRRSKSPKQKKDNRKG